jgi:hypothetical protein
VVSAEETPRPLISDSLVRVKLVSSDVKNCSANLTRLVIVALASNIFKIKRKHFNFIII